METILRRHLWALDLLVVAVAAAVAAHATSLAAGATLLRLSLDGEAFAGSAPGPQAPRPDHRGEAIVRRDIFCSSCRTRPDRGEDEATPETSLPLRLLAIMYAAPPSDPRQSAAVIKDERGAAGAYVVGSSLGAATVDAIDPLRVSLRLPDGRRQFLTLLDRPPPSERATVTESASDPLVAELIAGLKQIGENHYGVRRATVESFAGKDGRAGAAGPPGT